MAVQLSRVLGRPDGLAEEEAVLHPVWTDLALHCRTRDSVSYQGTDDLPCSGLHLVPWVVVYLRSCAKSASRYYPSERIEKPSSDLGEVHCPGWRERLEVVEELYQHFEEAVEMASDVNCSRVIVFVDVSLDYQAKGCV
jgi:hypothetical protein